jgi:hypothetical protein
LSHSLPILLGKTCTSESRQVTLTVGRRGGRSWVRAEPIMAAEPELRGLPLACGGAGRRGGGGWNSSPAKTMSAAAGDPSTWLFCPPMPYGGQQSFGVAGCGPRRVRGMGGCGRRGPRRGAVGMAGGAHQGSMWLFTIRRPTRRAADWRRSGRFSVPCWRKTRFGLSYLCQRAASS